MVNSILNPERKWLRIFVYYLFVLCVANEAPRPRGAGYQFSITTVIGDCYGVLYNHFLGFLHS